MSVIIAEEKLDELFNTLPMILGGEDKDLKPIFEFGTTLDLTAFLNDQSKLEKYPYPLIFMETPVRATGGVNLITLPLTLILATRTKSHFTPRQRLDRTIGQRLKPLLDNIIFAFDQGSNTRIIKDRNDFNNAYSTEIYYNYGNPKGNGETQTEQPDIWDAIKFKCDLEITNNCLLPIKY